MLEGLIVNYTASLNSEVPIIIPGYPIFTSGVYSSTSYHVGELPLAMST